MNSNLALHSLAAVTIAFVHTLCGPDHYVPFVAMSRAGNWSTRKTFIVTLLSGMGHVGSSVLLGFIGIILGVMVTRLEFIEGMRGTAAGWLLTAFGVAYMIWGIIYSLKQKPYVHMHIRGGRIETHIHSHDHSESVEHEDEHSRSAAVSENIVAENGDATALRSTTAEAARLTPWILFTIFIFGPCEPLIPLLMYPASQMSIWGVVLVASLFSVTTIATMLVIVMGLLKGAEFLHFPRLHRYSHALAGMMLTLCGVAITFGL